MERLPDQLGKHLRLVFVGTAAGQRSADLGHYYAGRGNRFWPTIHEVGITPRRYENPYRKNSFRVRMTVYFHGSWCRAASTSRETCGRTDGPNEFAGCLRHSF